VHASGKISEIYGAEFAPQDGFARQCRMPEPPLLLADRVVGLDAEPATMGLGTIWTETDITADAWYLHDDRIPAGVLIESGQADLMLISYLGIDLQHDGDRVYRLLGCTLTYHGDLPRSGETIRYDIHVDGHAKHGDVRLFFFHYDCFTTDDNGEHGLGRPILSVREGQAGFFTDAELEDSAGVLWTPEEQEVVENPRLDAPPIAVPARSFSRDEVHALAEGRPWDCFGPSFDVCKPHVWTPRFQTERMFFLNGQTTFDPQGGPWRRGYLKCVVNIEADEWYFDGHFKNDPCMPGTLMFEGCLQAMAFYLTAMGVTAKRDGWRFQPVTEEPFELKCRGQVDPGTKLLTYEIFVEEFIAGPTPTLYADLLCTSDGLKAFHARRVGLQLVPDWPVSRLPQLVERFPDADVKQLLDGNFTDPVPVAEADGFRFGYHSMVACAWGKPSDAFGPMYARYDGGAHVARLPGEPYHFMTRTTRIDGEIGSFRAGNSIVIEYDVPPDAWYFRENDCDTMPFCVFLEAALQPCGWLACFVGSTLTSDDPLFFRNLDGTGTMLAEIVPTAGTLRTAVTLTNISRSGPMIIQSFDVDCFVGDTKVYALKTVFGFFPAEALANQVGLPCKDADFALLTEPCDVHIDLKGRPDEFFAGAPKLPDPRLCLLDRLTGWWPEGGAQGLGRLRGEKDVDPSEWYFKAHFYTDPVQPGSLGIEALIRLLQLGCMLKGLGEGMDNPRFEPLRIGEEMSWKYRGQVIPTNKLVQSTLDIVEQGEDERGPYLVAEGSLWVDGKRIYEVKKMGMRVVDGGPEGPSSGALPPSRPGGKEASASVRTLDPAVDTWLGDHRPTFTVPSVPMMGVAELLAEAVPGTVTGLKDVRVTGWLTVEEPRRLRTETQPATGGTKVTLFDADSGEALAEGTVLTGDYAEAPAPTPVSGTAPVADPYASGHLFHGPAFQLLSGLERGPGVARGTLDASKQAVPVGRLHPALLDAATHLVPHDELAAWGADVPADRVAYPALLRKLTVHGPAPTGPVQATARLLGQVGELVRLGLEWVSEGRVWATAELLEMPFPKGPIGSAPAAERMAFLRDGRFSSAVRLSEDIDGQTVLDASKVRASDWLPGTVAATYGTAEPREIALKEHLAHNSAGAGGGLHPRALPAGLPLLAPTVAVSEDGDTVRVEGPVQLDLGPVKDWWADWFGQTSWPTEDLYYGLIEQFVRHVFVEDPAAFAAIQGRPALFLANHQTAVESLVFSIVASALIGTPTVTVAKVEHKQTWLGQLIRHGFSWPGVEDPQVITYFDRDDKASLIGIIHELHAGLAGGTKSAMVHVEGTRSFDCTQPVSIMTGKFIDLALEAGVPIVPVAFAGGLPREPLETRTEFPVGFGKQDLYLGRPLLPEELVSLPYGERKKRVLAGINATGPDCAHEQPLPGDPDLARAVAGLVAETGATEEHATLLALLQRRPEVCPQTRRLLEAVARGETELGDSPEDQWLSVVARWFRPS
jgi:3-hydroxymyristoyl/3-hydroxydecanoyl-(acyl carrier protein) dehydratase/1-acyl-sn-glycerol-3-phosphate acyltransferase